MFRSKTFHVEGAFTWSAPRGLARSCALGVDVEGVERLTRRHEQPIALWTAEADVGADFRQSNAADQLSVPRPHGHAAVAETADGGIAVARNPEISVDIGVRAIRATLESFDHEMAEQCCIADLVVGADGERIHVAVSARTLVSRSCSGADDVELLVVGREGQPV